MGGGVKEGKGGGRGVEGGAKERRRQELKRKEIRDDLINSLPVV